MTLWVKLESLEQVNKNYFVRRIFVSLYILRMYPTVNQGSIVRISLITMTLHWWRSKYNLFINGPYYHKIPFLNYLITRVQFRAAVKVLKINSILSTC